MSLLRFTGRLRATCAGVLMASACAVPAASETWLVNDLTALRLAGESDGRVSLETGFGPGSAIMLEHDRGADAVRLQLSDGIFPDFAGLGATFRYFFLTAAGTGAAEQVQATHLLLERLRIAAEPGDLFLDEPHEGEFPRILATADRIEWRGDLGDGPSGTESELVWRDIRLEGELLALVSPQLAGLSGQFAPGSVGIDGTAHMLDEGGGITLVDIETAVLVNSAQTHVITISLRINGSGGILEADLVVTEHDDALSEIRASGRLAPLQSGLVNTLARGALISIGFPADTAAALMSALEAALLRGEEVRLTVEPDSPLPLQSLFGWGSLPVQEQRELASGLQLSITIGSE